MPFLFIGSTGDRAGHSLVAWAIARRLLEKGMSVGFIKPFGTDPVHMHGQWTDQDAFLFKEALNLSEPLERICPYLVSDETWRNKGNDEILEELKTLAREVSEAKDIVLILGSKHIFFDDAACPIPDVTLIPELNADFILVHRYRKVSKAIYSILSVSSLLRERIKGIVLNRVPPEEIREIQTRLVPSLREKGIPICAALPEDPVLSFRSLREVGEVLEGQWLCGEELGRPVGAMTVGATDLTEGLLLFKRAYNKIILLEPAPNNAEAAAPRPVVGIVLTGGRSPAPQLLQAAKRAKVPLLLVKQDTFPALERLEQSTSHLSPGDDVKVRHILELMDYEGELDRLIESLKPAGSFS
ncbi:MAG: phosphotransacetylase family protein [Deltaproteobacteria bacterium]|nr:phosphotransacetylase family protein [Deltaproteobacteria bacterium]